MQKKNLHPFKSSRLIHDRVAFIQKYIEGKEVLDFGCVAHDYRLEQQPDWLHKQICQIAKSVVGVDWDDEGVKNLNQKGYNIVSSNAERLHLGQTFDVVIAGEFIEHLSNQGLFLEVVQKHLKKGGYFILTTPNSTGINNFLEVLLFSDVKINKDHMLWHNYSTLKQLFGRHNFSVVEYHYLFKISLWKYKGFKKFLILLRDIFCYFFILLRKKFAGTIIVVVQTKD